MNITPRFKTAVAALAIFSVGAMAGGQFKIGELIKVVGVGAAVSKFGPQINSEINKVAHTPDTATSYSKVVPILSGGINSRKSIGAAQVRGPKKWLSKVNAVAQVNQDLFGEINVRILIPIASKDVIKDLHPVPNVGVTGIIDLKVHL